MNEIIFLMIATIMGLIIGLVGGLCIIRNQVFYALRNLECRQKEILNFLEDIDSRTIDIIKKER